MVCPNAKRIGSIRTPSVDQVNTSSLESVKGPWTGEPRISQPSTNATATRASGPSWGTAGIPAVVQVEQVPEGWDLSRGIQCTPDPGVRDAGAVGAAVLGDRPSKLPIPFDIVIKKSAIPAGDFVTMTQFQSHGRQETTDFGVKTGKQTTCVPRYVYAADGGPVVR